MKRINSKITPKKKTTQTQYFANFLLKELRNSLKFFLQTQKGVALIVSILKFSSPSQKSYFFSLLGFFVPMLSRFNQGPFFVAKLTNYLASKEKKIMIKIFTSFFSKFLFSSCQVRIFDLIYQCFFSKGEKELSKIVLFFDKDLCFFYRRKIFYKSLEVFRVIHSGFSNPIKKKISEMIIEFCYFFLENASIISLAVSQEIFWAGLRILPKKFFYTIKKKSSNSLAFMNNSLYGLLTVSVLLEKNVTLKIKKITDYLGKFLQKFLRNKYGHVFILLLLFEKNPKKNFLKKEIFSTISLDSKFHIISCLCVLRFFSRNFLKKKLYKILNKKEKRKVGNFKKIEKILNKKELCSFVQKITNSLYERKILSFLVLLKTLFALIQYKKENFSKPRTFFLNKIWVLEKNFFKNDIKLILKSGTPTRLGKKVTRSQKVLVFVFLVFILRNFSPKKKKFLFFNQEKSIFFSINNFFSFYRVKNFWRIWIQNRLRITTNFFLATESLIRNQKNY